MMFSLRALFPVYLRLRDQLNNLLRCSVRPRFCSLCVIETVYVLSMAEQIKLVSGKR